MVRDRGLAPIFEYFVLGEWVRGRGRGKGVY